MFNNKGKPIFAIAERSKSSIMMKNHTSFHGLIVRELFLIAYGLLDSNDM